MFPLNRNEQKKEMEMGAGGRICPPCPSHSGLWVESFCEGGGSPGEKFLGKRENLWCCFGNNVPFCGRAKLASGVGGRVGGGGQATLGRRATGDGVEGVGGGEWWVCGLNVLGVREWRLPAGGDQIWWTGSRWVGGS